MLQRQERIDRPKEVNLRPVAGAFEQRVPANLRAIKRFAQIVGERFQGEGVRDAGLFGVIMSLAEGKALAEVEDVDLGHAEVFSKERFRAYAKNFIQEDF